jgi:2Fe-2S ferredoxin
MFAPYELVWAGGDFFRAVAQTMYTVSRPIVVARQALARQREKSHKRRQAKVQRATRVAQEREAARAVAQPSAPAPAPKPTPRLPVAKRGDTAASLPTPDIVPGEGASDKPR